MGAIIQQYPPNMRARQVQEALGIKRSAMYSLIKKGKLPKPFHIGRSSLWVTTEIQAVVDAKIAERDEVTA